MFIKRKLLLLVLIMLSSGVFAEDACNISGKWFDPVNDYTEYSLHQAGTTFTGKSIFEDDACGSFVLSGAITGNNATFDVVYAKRDNEECGYHAKAQVVFAGNCAVLKGTSTDTDSSEVNEFSLDREPIRITSPAAGSEFIINTEPRMPSFKAAAEVYLPSSMTYLNNVMPRNEEAPFSWKVKIEHKLRSDKIVKGELNDAVTYDGMYQPDFQQIGWPLGGKLTLSVEYFHSVRDEKTYIVKGTNPGKALIEQMVVSSVLRQIACNESHYKQFVANREGGVGFPVVGTNEQGIPVGGIGIFQAFNPDPKDYQIWDWRNNVKYGIDLFELKKTDAKRLPKTELHRLNKERKALNLPLCQSLPQLTQEQIEREALRRYNGGREYQWEPREDKDCKGQWVIKPWLPPHAIANYVEKVLSCRL